MLYRMMGIAETAFEKALNDGVRDPELAFIQDNMMKQYRKLYNMDVFHLLQYDANPEKGRYEDEWVQMNHQQIAKNDEHKH